MSGWASSDRRAHLPRDWAKRRLRVKRRAHGRCECLGDCGQHEDRCTEPGTDCDHLAGRDDHRLEVLQWLCSDCHDRKTMTERQRDQNEAKKRAKRPPPRHPGLI